MLPRISKIYKSSLCWFVIICGLSTLLVFINSIISDWLLEHIEQKNMLVQQSNFTPRDSQIILSKIRTYKSFSGKMDNTTITSGGCSQDNSKIYNLSWRGYQINEFNQIFNNLITQGLIKVVAFKISRQHKLDHDYIYGVALGETQPVFTGIIRFKVYNHDTAVTNTSFCRE